MRFLQPFLEETGNKARGGNSLDNNFFFLFFITLTLHADLHAIFGIKKSCWRKWYQPSISHILKCLYFFPPFHATNCFSCQNVLKLTRGTNIRNTTIYFQTFQLASQLCSEWTLLQNSSKHEEKGIGKGQRNKKEKRGQKRAQIRAPIIEKKVYINQHKTDPNSEIYKTKSSEDNSLKVTCSPMTSSSSNCMLMT